MSRTAEIVWNVGAELVTPARTCPVVPALVAVTADVVLPRRTPLAVSVDAPVPPRPTASCPVQPAVIDVAANSAVVGVPPNVSVTFVSSVLVSADPVTPMAPVVALSVMGAVALAAKVPDVFGKVSVAVPAAACGVMVTVPDVLPVSAKVPSVVPATPSVGVAVAVIVLAVPEARMVPAALVAGYVDVDQEGAALEPERMI